MALANKQALQTKWEVEKLDERRQRVGYTAKNIAQIYKDVWSEKYISLIYRKKIKDIIINK